MIGVGLGARVQDIALGIRSRLAAATRRAEVTAEIAAVEGRIEGLEWARDATDSHGPVGELDPTLRPETLPAARRLVWDGLRMIAHHAETLAPQLGQPATVRSFAKALF